MISLFKKKKTEYEEGWDSYSDSWDDSIKKKGINFLGDEWGAEALSRDIVEVFVHPYIGPGSVALEIGCGGGKYSILLAPLCRRIIRSDVSPKMLERTKKRIGEKENIAFEKLNGYDLRQFKDNTIDFVFSFDVFVHIDIEDIYSYLLEIRRVLRPKGRGVLHFANLNSPKGWNKFVAECSLNRGNNKHFDRFRFLTWEIVERFLKSTGFDILYYKKEPWRDIVVVFEKP